MIPTYQGKIDAAPGCQRVARPCRSDRQARGGHSNTAGLPASAAPGERLTRAFRPSTLGHHVRTLERPIRPSRPARRGHDCRLQELGGAGLATRHPRRAQNPFRTRPVHERIVTVPSPAPALPCWWVSYGSDSSSSPTRCGSAARAMSVPNSWTRPDANTTPSIPTDPGFARE